MKNMWPLLIPIIVILVSLPVISFSVDSGVYGKFIEDSDLEVFLQKHLSTYELNEYDKPKYEMLYSFGLPYISRHTGLRWNWYIQNYGRVRSSSRLSKVIDKYWMSLPRPKEKTIADL